ncbi:MAG: thiamine-phosphate kinase, partial [Kiritimatiellia bacterium]
MDSLEDIGEVNALKRITSGLEQTARVIEGPGDDCAVIRADDGSRHDLLLTSDPVIMNTHFTPETPPAAVGRKAVGRVLSDIAAMGGEPLSVLFDISAKAETPVSFLQEVYGGAASLGRKFGISVAGGDLSRGESLEIHAFAVGKVPRGGAVLRSGARAGDVIMATGVLGGSSRGKHIDFLPRVNEGIWLRQGRWISSLIDISDSPARDITHIAEASAVGAEIEIARLPVSKDAALMADGKKASRHALYDGEDFE